MIINSISPSVFMKTPPKTQPFNFIDEAINSAKKTKDNAKEVQITRRYPGVGGEALYITDTNNLFNVFNISNKESGSKFVMTPKIPGYGNLAIFLNASSTLTSKDKQTGCVITTFDALFGNVKKKGSSKQNRESRLDLANRITELKEDAVDKNGNISFDKSAQMIFEHFCDQYGLQFTNALVYYTPSIMNK